MTIGNKILDINSQYQEEFDSKADDTEITALQSQITSLTNTINTLNNTLNSIDYVIQRKEPTSSNPTWYRVYKSGWVEQGGKSSNFTNTAGNTSGPVVITLPIKMTNDQYSVTATRAYDLTKGNASISGYSHRMIIVDPISTTQIKIDQYTNAAASGTSVYAEWVVRGMKG